MLILTRITEIQMRKITKCHFCSSCWQIFFFNVHYPVLARVGTFSVGGRMVDFRKWVKVSMVNVSGCHKDNQYLLDLLEGLPDAGDNF